MSTAYGMSVEQVGQGEARQERSFSQVQMIHGKSLHVSTLESGLHEPTHPPSSPVLKSFFVSLKSLLASRIFDMLIVCDPQPIQFGNIN